jgi:hypothetical protein
MFTKMYRMNTEIVTLQTCTAGWGEVQVVEHLPSENSNPGKAENNNKKPSL